MGALSLESHTKNPDVKTLCSEEAPLLFSSFLLSFPLMISISNSSCFALGLHACAHAITALQVVACDQWGKKTKKSCLCRRVHLCVYV